MGRRPFIINGKHIKVRTYGDKRITVIIRTKYINDNASKFLIITLTPVSSQASSSDGHDSFYSSPAALFECTENGQVVFANDAFWQTVSIKKDNGFNIDKFKLDNAASSMSALIWLEKCNSMRNHTMKLLDSNKFYSLNISTVIRNGKSFYCGNVEDITSNILKQKKEKHLLYHDPMTNLYNRTAYEEKIKSFDIKASATVIICDMDNLKLINDAFSHQYGDYAIMIIAEALNKVFSNNFIARIGGDEFIVILEDSQNINIRKKISDLNTLCNIPICSNITAEISIGYCDFKTESDYKKALDYAENKMYRQKYSKRSQRQQKLLNTLAAFLYSETGETKRHCTFVSQLSCEIIKELGHLRAEELKSILISGRLHDIGKITMPKILLKNKKKFTESEMKLMKNHSEAGYRILNNITSSTTIKEGVLHHHERYDGTGYPYGLSGKQIPLFARIIAVADAYDAMTKKREYKKLLLQPQAIVEIMHNSGTQFDPDIVAAFSKVNLNKLSLVF